MDSRTIENAFIVQDETHSVYRGSDHFLAFHVTNGRQFIHIRSNLGSINPFCRYVFYGKYIGDKKFRAEDCSMEPAQTDMLLLSKFLHIFKLRDPQFSVINWLSVLKKWRGSPTTADVFKNELLPIIRTYAETYPDVAFFCYPELYTFVHRFYETNSVFNWSLATCRALESQLTNSPFDLTFSSPYPEMEGACIELELLKELCPETERNKPMYDVCAAAEFFCFNSVGTKNRSDFNPEILSVLVEKQILRIVLNKVVLARTYDMYEQLQRLRFVSVDTRHDLVLWCKKHSDFNFLTKKEFMLDIEIPVSYTLDPSKQNCFLHVDLWTISDVQKALNGADPSSAWGIGFKNSIGNRCGYNLFHFIPAQIPPIPSLKVDESTLEGLLTRKTRSGCVVVNVGRTIFHNPIVQKLKEAFPSTRGRKITFATTVPFNKIPYEFIRTVKNVSDRAYHPKDRVVFDQHRSRVIKDVFFDSVKSSETGKRKRRSHCRSTSEYKPGKKIVLDFKTGDTMDFKDIKTRLNHWGLLSADQALSLFEDVLILFSNDLDYHLMISLRNCCKMLVVIVPENTPCKEKGTKLKTWELISFTDIK